MSIDDTRLTVIAGVCNKDPERWREFDSIYRPMLFAYLRKQGLKEFEANDRRPGRLREASRQDPDLRPDQMQVSQLALQPGP